MNRLTWDSYRKSCCVLRRYFLTHLSLSGGKEAPLYGNARGLASNLPSVTAQAKLRLRGDLFTLMENICRPLRQCYLAAVLTLACGLFGLNVGWLLAEDDAPQHLSDWSASANLGSVVNSAFSEQHPAISPDNLSLYFISDRPGGSGGFDLWFSHRIEVDMPWGPPQNLGAILNSSASEFAPAFDPSGHLLFFGSERPGGCGNRDLWVSFRKNKKDDLGWQAPVNLGCGVNSSEFDDGPAYFEDDRTGLGTLYFISSRPGGLGDRDVWSSTRNPDGSFNPPVNVFELNSSTTDARPAIRRDGLEFLLTSQRFGSVPQAGVPSNDIWMATRDSTLDLWSAPANLESLNTSSTEGAPTISRHGLTLYFNSNRSGGVGGFDLYVTARTKGKGCKSNE